MRNLNRPLARPTRSGGTARSRMSASAETIDAGVAYEGARHTGTFMRKWPVQLQSIDREYFPARHNLVGRTRDQFRNDPIASAGVARKKNAAVGRGWRFSSKPNARALGIDPKAARELGQLINTEWKLYANSYAFLSDAERKLHFGQQLRVATSHLMQDGEFLAQVVYAEDDPAARYKTCLKLLDPDRLGNPLGRMNGDNLRAGVEFNDNEVPIAYHIRERHPRDIGFSAKSMTYARHPRYSTPLGRPNILHGFDPDRAGQTRGISRFVSTLKSFRGFSKFTDATIQAATINALILGYIKSNSGFKAVGDAFNVDDLIKFDESRNEHYKENAIELGDAIMPTLAYDDEIQLATASKDVTQFEPFTRSIIRLIAAALGVTYEELSMDYSQTNYSSARAAMIHAWSDTLALMGTLESHLVKPFFVAWLEEAFDSGRITPPEGAPDFYEAIDAYADGRWLGPGRGYIDPVKEILAATARIEAGISTLEDECAEQGKDYEEVLEQKAHERQLKADLGLPDDEPGNNDPNTPPEDTETTDAADRKPGDKSAARQKRGFFGSALARIRAIAMSAEHEASLDARPV